jgi:hypothetical protein
VNFCDICEDENEEPTMKIIECLQGSAEWFDARLGKPTASNFGQIVTSLGKPRSGVAPRRYMIELLGERLTRKPTQHFETDAMQRGIQLEPVAVQHYANETGRPVRSVGFVVSECGRFGGSPDGLCDDRGIEVKCPLTSNFVEIAESSEIPDDWRVQIQGLLWLTKFSAWDFVLYTDVPGLLPQIIEVRPDAKLVAAFDEALQKFCDELDATEKKMREAGHGLQAVTRKPAREWDDPFETKTII